MKFILTLSVYITLIFSAIAQNPTITFTPFTTAPYWFGEQTSFSLGYFVNGVSVITPACNLNNSSASVTGNGGATATINPSFDAVLVTWGNQKTTNPGAKVNVSLSGHENH